MELSCFRSELFFIPMEFESTGFLVVVDIFKKENNIQQIRNL